MKVLIATVTDNRNLELSEDISIPAGTKVQVNIIETDFRKDYEERIAHYYATCGEEARQEERLLAEELIAGDAPLPDEEPWW